MKAKKMSRGFIIMALIVVMAATTAVSFAFWSAGIDGNSGTDNSGSVIIGEGNYATTSVSLGEMSDDAEGKVLIPYTVTLGDNETHSVNLTINVKWLADIDEDDVVTGVDGVLTVSCSAIISESGADLTEALGVGGEKLFEITFDKEAYDIIGNDSVGADVTITIRLAEPSGKAQYDLIANKEIFFTFEFVVADAEVADAA